MNKETENKYRDQIAGWAKELLAELTEQYTGKPFDDRTRGNIERHIHYFFQQRVAWNEVANQEDAAALVEKFYNSIIANHRLSV